MELCEEEHEGKVFSEGAAEEGEVVFGLEDLLLCLVDLYLNRRQRLV